MSECTVRFDVSDSLADFPQSVDAEEWMSDAEAVENAVAKLVDFIIDNEGVSGDIEVSVTFVTRLEINDLNLQYRDIDAPTDVLSFNCDDPQDSDGETIILGDVIISPEVAYDQTALYGTTLSEEMELLITHGMLHLLGYDHIEDEDAEEMEAREREIKQAWKSRK